MKKQNCIKSLFTIEMLAPPIYDTMRAGSKDLHRSPDSVGSKSFTGRQ
jgi:hypothetical protein